MQRKEADKLNISNDLPKVSWPSPIQASKNSKQFAKFFVLVRVVTISKPR